MRVRDIALHCVGFVAEVMAEKSDGTFDYEMAGTGVFVSVPVRSLPGKSFCYFVTARHVVNAMRDRSTALFSNIQNGGRSLVPLANPVWFVHPDADLALIQVNDMGVFDVTTVPMHSLATEETMKAFDIGVGDEVFMIGLFEYLEGRVRNMPIVRTGNVAMFPKDQIYIDMGDESKYVNAYLIEARSMGGISGSPVFVRPTTYYRGKGLSHNK